MSVAVCTSPLFPRFQIRVLDDNDSKPQFLEPLDGVITVREEQQAGFEVVQVHATDADEGENATITYSFSPGRARTGRASSGTVSGADPRHGGRRLRLACVSCYPVIRNSADKSTEEIGKSNVVCFLK